MYCYFSNFDQINANKWSNKCSLGEHFNQMEKLKHLNHSKHVVFSVTVPEERMAWWHGNLQNLTGHVQLRESFFKTVWLQNHLVGHVCAAKVKVYGFLGLLCVNLAYGDHTTFLQEQSQWISISIVAHSQGGAHTLMIK